MANLTLAQIRSSEAFKALTRTAQEQFANVYEQTKGLNTPPSTEDLEAFLAEHTPSEDAAQAASFLQARPNAGTILQMPESQTPGLQPKTRPGSGTRTPGHKPLTKEGLVDEAKILLWKWGQPVVGFAKGTLTGLKTWKDLLVRVEEKLEDPTAKKEVAALRSEYAPLMDTAITDKNVAALAEATTDVLYKPLREIGSLTLYGGNRSISGAFLSERLDAASPELRTKFLERYGIKFDGDKYLLPVAFSVTGGFVVAAGTGIESVWQGLVAQGFSEQQIANHPELLAWVAQKNGISDFSSIANDVTIRCPTPDQLDAIVAAVRADLTAYSTGIQAVYGDAAKAFVAEMSAMSLSDTVRSYPERAHQLWSDSQAKRMSELMRALQKMDLDQIRDLRKIED